MSEYDAVAGILERGLPLVREPFAEIGARLGIPERDVLIAAREMKNSGLIRRFGAFFDYHRLGFRGYLFGSDVSGASGKVIEKICGMPSVTHAYGREHKLNFWFTALFKETSAVSCVEKICSYLEETGCPFVVLETVSTIKLRPSFAGYDLEPRSTAIPPFPESLATDERLLKIVIAMSGETPLTSRPFDIIAGVSGVSVDELLRGAERLSEMGILRRIGASFDHYKAGWNFNSLCAARARDIFPSGAGLSGILIQPWVSHCYLRKVYYCDNRVAWPYNLYMMIHADSEDMLAGRENILRRELSDNFLNDKSPDESDKPDFVSMRTTREYKKISFKMDWRD